LFSKSMPLIDARLRGFIVTANQGKTAHASRRTTQAKTLRFRVGMSQNIHLPSAFPNGFLRPPSHIPSPS
jgi:hypothetical protein